MEGQKIALVTGAGRGIGKAIAQALAREKIHVICTSKSLSNCSAVAQEITGEGGSATAFAVDIAHKEEILIFCENLLNQYERIDIFVNNAGITRDNLLLRMSAEDWEEVIKVNLNSVFYWTKGILHPMIRHRWGRIVSIASVSGVMGNAGQTNYAAAKAGLIGFSKALAKECASRNVTVNAIAPGFIETDMTKQLPPEVIEGIQKVVPLKRMGTTFEVASLVKYLCSEEAAYITGQVFVIDGGMRM